METILSTRDLPASMQAPAIAVVDLPVTVTRVVALTCEHGPACPTCVLDAARRVLAADASLVGDVPTRL